MNPVPASAKERLYAAIVAAGEIRDWPDLKARIDFYIDPHNGKHLLYSLQKEGRIVFNTAKQGSEENVIDIRPVRAPVNLQPEYLVINNAEFQAILAKEGLDVVQETRGVGRPARVIHARGRHPVGKDMTSPEQHKAVAQGGPIERTHVAPQRVTLDDIPLPRQNEKPLSAPVPPVPTVPGLKTIYEVIDWERYPLIVALGERGEKITAAAKLLEEIGLTDQALDVLAQTDNYSPLEREIIALVKELK